MSSFGRRVHKAGLKLMFIFPYAFVDTSEAWFEPRRRRIAISAAGPVSDFSLGALFAICCLVMPDGTVRDISFNLAFAAYVGVFFNLNPFIDRDGSHILVDVLGEPGLRRRAKEQFQRRLSGKGVAEKDSPVLARYSIFGVGWLVLAGCLVIGITLRFKPIIEPIRGRLRRVGGTDPRCGWRASSLSSSSWAAAGWTASAEPGAGGHVRSRHSCAP